MIEVLALVITIIGVILIPIIKYLYSLSLELNTLKTEIKIIKEFQTDYKEDISKLFQKIDDLKDEIHHKAENYIHKNNCKSIDCKK